MILFLLWSICSVVCASDDLPIGDVSHDDVMAYIASSSRPGVVNLLLRDVYPMWQPEPPEAKSGEPLILTQLIEEGEIEEARRLSKVEIPSDFYGEELNSYSGFLTVDAKYDSNLFFWFFPVAKEDPNNEIPILLWLQGGPGASSLIGLFLEFGPFSVEDDSRNFTLKKNEHSWHKEYSLLFIDQPVGTGFSFTRNPKGYAKNITTSSAHLYNALTQFFAIFGEYEKNPFYITGESYAGKYVPALAYEIHQRNILSSPWINLKGIAVGNGYTDPTSMLNYSKYMYQLGLIDTPVRRLLETIEKITQNWLENNEYVQAFYGYSAIWRVFYKASGFKTPYNFLKVNDDDSNPLTAAFARFVQTAEMRQALHVGGAEFNSIGEVYWNMLPDFMSSGKAYLEEVMKHYHVLLYSGQLDIICAYPLTVKMIETLDFDEKAMYSNASRWLWYVKDDLAGYVKSSGRFTEVLVRNSGHLFPSDQPVWALDLIKRFTSGKLRPEEPHVPGGSIGGKPKKKAARTV